ncbi:PASTA domain-containing protein [Streptomyces roseolus]|uniref:PASTA domain-containing protein n=1 Tax=Streptomyces roseolus TaxID=67358 RepID=UPI0036485C80
MSSPYGSPKKKRSTGAVVALVVGGVFALLVVFGALAEPEESRDDKTGNPSAPVAKTTAAPPSDPEPATAPPARSGSAELPGFVGMGLQSAQDRAQELGYHRLTSHDALGRGRHQISDRNWKVCFQSPRPGRHRSTTEVDFGTVKLEETCPAEDAGGDVAEAGSTMPDFTGTSVKVARQALDSSTGLTVQDASDEDRSVLVESNWQVCSQEPAAGTALDGRPVVLRAVKFDENC